MACNTFGVTNRWGFSNDGLDTETVHLARGNSHLVAGIFDRELNQWVFIDGRYSTLGAYLGGVGPLTQHEFFLFLNQPNRSRHHEIVHYDPVTNREQRMRAEDNPKPFDSYLGWTKGYHTADRDTALVGADRLLP